MNIKVEIDSVKSLIISNDDELNLVRLKYFSEDGILPKIYKLASESKGSKSIQYLNALVEIRRIVDSKISDFILSH